MKELQTEHIPIQFIEPVDIEITQEIEDLTQSIRDRGLLHPIAVQCVNREGGTPHYVIKAGRKRFKALEKLEIANVPCILLSGSDTELEMIQIEENLRRYNLPWWEVAENVAKWHTLRQQEKGISEAKKGKAKRERPGHSMRDTADELGLSLGFISEAIKLDDAVKRDPTLRNIKDRDTAIRVVRNTAKRIEAELYAEAPVEFAVNQVYNASATEILKRFPNSVFHACITDPPWLKYIDEKLTRDDETVPVFREVYRVLRSDSFLYMFVGFDDFRSYSRRLPEFGFTVAKTPLIWVKKELKIHQVHIGMDESENRISEWQPYLHGVTLSKGARAWEYSRDFELILLAVKGSPSLVHATQQSSIKVYPPLPPVKLTHPNEKPVSLIIDLLKDCTHEGSLVLDPFSGSGAHLEACEETGRRWIGIERDHESYVKIKERMAK